MYKLAKLLYPLYGEAATKNINFVKSIVEDILDMYYLIPYEFKISPTIYIATFIK